MPLPPQPPLSVQPQGQPQTAGNSLENSALPRGADEVSLSDLTGQSIGYQPSQRLTTYESETIYYPDLPSLDNPQAKQLADLTWALCVTARATAHGKMNLTTFTKLKNQFSADNIAKHPINLVLTFAPELYAYYTALLDFALLKNAQQ